MTVQSQTSTGARRRCAALDADLIEWFDATGRDLPWRRTRDPWVILVSEIMLQQTQVGRVVARLSDFIGSFPSPTVCADASPGAVIGAWSGLGYNRRARHLHAAAVRIRDHHDGAVPRELTDLLELPGVGRYTARAVRVFAYEEVEAVLDTNTGRVLARLQNRRLTAASAQRLADELVPADRPWHWNQALIELGALVCRPTPRCSACPIERRCAWSVAGRPEPDPAERSAGVSGPQRPFDGSDRQGRGRLLRRLTGGPLPTDAADSVLGWAGQPSRSRRVVAALIADGLVVEVDGHLRLP